MDFSLLADRRAPWHGYQGYVGTDNYRSPEHMTRGAVPGARVRRLHLRADPVRAARRRASRTGATIRPSTRGSCRRMPRSRRRCSGMMPAPASNAEVSAALHRCLSPDPAARPTAAELRAVLSGRGAEARARRGRRAPRPRPRRRRAPAAAAAPPRPRGAPLVADAHRSSSAPDGRALQIGVRTELGKALVRQFGADAEFWDDRQCVLERRADGQWMVSPVAGHRERDAGQRRAAHAPRALREGDVIAVGRAGQGDQQAAADGPWRADWTRRRRRADATRGRRRASTRRAGRAARAATRAVPRGDAAGDAAQPPPAPPPIPPVVDVHDLDWDAVARRRRRPARCARACATPSSGSRRCSTATAARRCCSTRDRAHADDRAIQRRARSTRRRRSGSSATCTATCSRSRRRWR